jgi:cell division protein FtsI (penicillin-binding protein 3)
MARSRSQTKNLTKQSRETSSKSFSKTIGFVSSLSSNRVIFVWGLLVLGILGMGLRLYKLQITDGAKLFKQAKRQQTTRLLTYVPRRPITDNMGNILAIDRLNYTIYVHPKLFRLPREQVAQDLSPLLPQPTTPDALLKKFKTKDSGLELAKFLSEDAAKKIKKLRLDGVDLEPQYVRFYPQDEVASEVVGYVDSVRQGQAGIENSQNHLLTQTSEDIYVQQAANSAILPDSLPKKALNLDQSSLQLTLDLRLQRAARSALAQQMNKYQAKRGAVIVMDARDGAILSMVCEPTYNPNQYSKSKIELFKNWTVSDLYEPGSTFKPINVAIALDAGVIKPDTYVYDSGSLSIDRWTILNASKMANGSINIARVLQVSSNIGMVEIMRRLPKDTFYEQLKKLGIGEKVGIDLPGEVDSHLKDKKSFLYNSIESATASFGQGFALTPIKLLQLHAALANGGTLVTPHLIRGMVDANGKLQWQPKLKTTANIFKPEVAHQVVEMMETVVTQGSGTAAYIPNYRIGGKTGTAQKARSRGGYIPNAKITSFVAILPVEAPRYVVLVLLDEPHGENTFGSTVAAPVAKLVIESLISLEGLPPSPDGPKLKVKDGKRD